MANNTLIAFTTAANALRAELGLEATTWTEEQLIKYALQTVKQRLYMKQHNAKKNEAYKLVKAMIKSGNTAAIEAVIETKDESEGDE
jgi:hypothetical protein